jgi:hypothetical protein
MAKTIAVAVGGNLASKALMVARNYAQITEHARRFTRIVRGEERLKTAQDRQESDYVT